MAWCVQSPKPLPKWMNFYVVIRDWEFPEFCILGSVCSTFTLYGLTRNYYRQLNFHYCHMVIFQVMLSMRIAYKAQGFVLQCVYITSCFCCMVAGVIVVAYYTTFQIAPGFWRQARNVSELISYGFQLSR